MLSAFTFVPILARESLGISEILVTIIVSLFAAFFLIHGIERNHLAALSLLPEGKGGT